MSVISPPAAAESTKPTFSAKSILESVRGLERPKAWVYWLDVTATVAVGNLAMGAYLFANGALWTAVGFIIAGFAFYRCSMFIHEIQHLRDGTFRAFKVYWNLVCGIPFLTPSFTYADHRGHHVNREYGTADDAEYLQLMNEPLWSVFYMLTRIWWIPPLFVLRYMFLPPLAWISPQARAWTWQYTARVAAINLRRNRPLPDAREEWYWSLQEFGCCVYCWTIIGLMAFGVLPWIILLKILCLSAFIISISHTRTITSHRFRNTGGEMTYLDQLLDSTTIVGHPLLTELWCPVGLRYHALHHLVATIPYHNMGIAHRRVMQTLPADSPYRDTLRTGLWDAIRDILRTVREARRRQAGRQAATPVARPAV